MTAQSGRLILYFPEDPNKQQLVKNELTKCWKGVYSGVDAQLNVVKIHILEKLINEKVVDTWELENQLLIKYEARFGDNVFCNACNAISILCKEK